ncbi:MAG: T9SS type A sorting domain-containing protein, partial [Bacteroidales bacterium]|nr:T9SS type A sorting domain-containing protein [Bacteroidales bacterium]
TGGGGQYNGEYQTPAVTVKFNGTDLIRDVDYTLVYQNNKDAGPAEVDIIGLFLYTGKLRKIFQIAQTPMLDMVWPILTLEEGQILDKAIYTGGRRDGVYKFTRPDAKPKLSDSNLTLYELTFTPNDHNYSPAKKDMTVTVKPPTGYKDRLQDEILIYPNPFSDEVHVKGSAGCTLKVLNVAGLMVHAQQLTDIDEIIRLDKLPAGIYFFRLEKAGKTKTLKVGKR